MDLRLKRHSEIPVYLQISSALREQILSGMLREGQSLPPEREMARRLGVNRSTVVKAYQELKAQGFLHARVGRGTVVKIWESQEEKRPFQGEPLDWRSLFNASSGIPGSFFSEMLSRASREGTISFASGFPDPEYFPREIVGSLQRELHRENSHKPYLPSPVEGYAPLRERIAAFLGNRGMHVPSRNIMILSGSQQGLDYVARSFLSPGDVVLTEEPTFFGALEIFRAAGARVVGIPMNDEGIRPDLLEGAIRRHNPRFLYLLPTFQNPSGITMSLERRREVLEIAGAAGIPLVEDDPYGELRYEGNRLPSLKALDLRESVIYLSSFSKVLSLGLRVGWVVAPSPVIDRFSRLKQITDLHVNTASQMLLEAFLRQGHYEEHLVRISQGYREKRNIMEKALKKHAQEVSWSWRTPEGGFYIWCRLPEGLPMRILLSRGAAQGVVFFPGGAFYPDEAGREGYIRLNFAHTPRERIEEGVARLARAAGESLRNHASFPGDSMGNLEPLV